MYCEASAVLSKYAVTHGKCIVQFTLHIKYMLKIYGSLHMSQWKCNLCSMLDSEDCTVHRGAFCQFPFRWIHYCHISKSTGTICVSKAYLKAKIRPSLVCCVPRMAYFCFITQKAGHSSISNIDRREKKILSLPVQPGPLIDFLA